MNAVRVRPKNQMPKTRAARKDNLMDYAGLARASYGKTARQIDSAVAKLRDEWTR